MIEESDEPSHTGGDGYSAAIIHSGDYDTCSSLFGGVAEAGFSIHFRLRFGAEKRFANGRCGLDLRDRRSETTRSIWDCNPFVSRHESP
jgi:hypothetical protein